MPRGRVDETISEILVRFLLQRDSRAAPLLRPDERSITPIGGASPALECREERVLCLFVRSRVPPGEQRALVQDEPPRTENIERVQRVISSVVCVPRDVREYLRIVSSNSTRGVDASCVSRVNKRARPSGDRSGGSICSAIHPPVIALISVDRIHNEERWRILKHENLCPSVDVGIRR